MTFRRAALGLLGAAHAGPTVAVTLFTALVAVSVGLDTGTAVLVTAAVLTGQLSIGWSNDLIDLARDQQVGRTDKPLTRGDVPVPVARLACAAAVLGTVVLSLATGLLPGLLHLGLVAAGWAYNLGLKSTRWSWAAYAFAFGGLPVFVVLAGDGRPEPWMPVAGALLGVGAHLVNALPDLADDEATGVRGLPHRLGPRWTQWLAVVVLATASVVIAVGAAAAYVVVALGLGLVSLLALVALVTAGRTPFRAAVGIALVDVVMLVVAS